ncbi:hypothetical protein [Kitasatospora cheerisanensis]|uniref:Uncharacterized protein n=1 Tax=Kitasatospora cheerisanensis KCTC 2395 TaxID=1348663 RepID=A0A066Z2T1_9ACTN|nr:hypothetical protein [Kitasatospora cheerisanensis]KDN88083.1 hypothetical protein KCH_01600 [Kitasatospora cheerisanensis KCTC 2395]
MVAALVALVAYLVPREAPKAAAPAPVASSGWTPDPTPAPVPSRSATPSPDPEPPSSAPSPAPARTSAPPLPLPTVRAAGCAQAQAAVAAYRRDPGSTRPAQADAANLAYQGLMRAGTDADPPVRPTILRLAQGFQELSFRLSGMVLADPNEVIGDLDSDLQQLDRLCGDGG